MVPMIALNSDDLENTEKVIRKINIGRLVPVRIPIVFHREKLFKGVGELIRTINN